MPQAIAGFAIERSTARSHVQLDHVAIGHRMGSANVLSVESALAPYARVLERPREVPVHEPRDVLHGLAPVEDERPFPVWRAARRLGVDTGRRAFMLPILRGTS